MASHEKYDPFGEWADKEGSSKLDRLNTVTVSVFKDDLTLAPCKNKSEQPQKFVLSQIEIEPRLAADIRELTVEVLDVTSEPINIDLVENQSFTYAPIVAMVRVTMVYEKYSGKEVCTQPLTQGEEFALGLFKWFRDTDKQNIPLFRVSHISEEAVTLGVVEEKES